MIDGKNLHIALSKPSLNLPRDHPRYTPTAFTCAGEIRGVAEDGHFRLSFILPIPGIPADWLHGKDER